MRVDRLGPKVVVWMADAGWWCLSAFLTRRVTPPSLPGMTPMACSNIVNIALFFNSHMRAAHSRFVVVVPCWRSSPRSEQSQSIVLTNPTPMRTLRLYTFLRLRGSRENWTPFALLTSVELRPSAICQPQSHTNSCPSLSLTGNLPGKIVRDSGGHCVCMECGYGRCRLLDVRKVRQY